MIATHGERFEATFWAFFGAEVGPRLPARPVIVDLGCGPGRWLRDLGERVPGATLSGYDVTPAMIDYGRKLAFQTASATFVLHDAVARSAAAPGVRHRPSRQHVVGPSRLRRAVADDGRHPACARPGRDLPAERLGSPAALRLSCLSSRRHEGERARRAQTGFSALSRAEQVHGRGLALAPRRGRPRDSRPDRATRLASDLRGDAGPLS